MDPDELTFPFERASKFRDMELGDELMAVPSVVRASYLAELERVLAIYKRDLRSMGVDYQLLKTSVSLVLGVLGLVGLFWLGGGLGAGQAPAP